MGKKSRGFVDDTMTALGSDTCLASLLVYRSAKQAGLGDVIDALALAVYKASFPGEEMFGLTSQLRRGAVSVPSNIEEGCARSSEAEYIRFLDTAYGSAREYQIGLSHRLGYLTEPVREELQKLSAESKFRYPFNRFSRPVSLDMIPYCTV